MRKILFDLLLCQPIGESKFHGGGEYIKRVFREVILTKSDDVAVSVYFDQDAFLDEWIFDLIKEYSIETYNIKTVSQIVDIFAEKQFDVFYTGMPYEYKKEYFPYKIYKIGTFHGMRAVECPHDHYEYKYIQSFSGRLKEHIRNLLKYTKYGYKKNINSGISNYKKCIGIFDKIVCDSFHTAYSLKIYYTSLENKTIETLYPPLKYSENSADDLEVPATGKYILMIGGNRWLKNTYRGIRAIDFLYSRGHLDDIKTVVVGSLNTKIKKEVKNKEKFEFKGYVEDKELNILYKNCCVFLYPTLNEGFGYPPLEAMQYGKTCIVSSVCSLPEVCGDAVYYVNPYDIGEIQNRILWALEKPIFKSKIQNQFLRISELQKDGLKRLCFIIMMGMDT